MLIGEETAMVNAKKSNVCVTDMNKDAVSHCTCLYRFSGWHKRQSSDNVSLLFEDGENFGTCSNSNFSYSSSRLKAEKKCAGISCPADGDMKLIFGGFFSRKQMKVMWKKCHEQQNSTDRVKI